MAVEFRLPDLGENIDAGEVINVLVAVGDSLAEDQAVIELETDKAVIEVPSSVSGTIAAVHVGQGDKAEVGQVILTVEADAAAAPSRMEETPPASPAAAAEPPPSSGQIEVRLPELGEGTDSGDVVGILVSPGDIVEAEQGLVEIEMDKGVVEVPSTEAGTILQIHVSKGDNAAVGQLIATLEAAGPVAAPESAPPPGVEAAAPEPTPDRAAPAPEAGAEAGAYREAAPVPGSRKLVPAAPSVRRLAREIGVDITQVPGSGPAGRISPADVKAHSKALHDGGPTSPAAVAAAPLPDFSKWGEIERQPMSNVRRLTAEHMTRAWTTIPQVTQFDKTDITDLEVWRKKFGAVAEAAGGKLTPTAIVLKIVASALKKFPQFGASVDMASEEVILKKYVSIGVAVDTPRGLIVPVVRDVNDKNMVELAVELTDIADRARKGKISVDEMQGGCFTISNLGGIGGTAFTPIVNAPEVAILGVARGRQEPVLVDGEFTPRLMMPLSLSYDHRVIDGADGARFLRWICEALENPFLIALEG